MITKVGRRIIHGRTSACSHPEVKRSFTFPMGFPMGMGREVSSEELCILASWFMSPMSKNSVLEELTVRRLAVIQEEIC